MEIIENDDPDWVIGCPPCTDFSVLGRSNHRRMDPDEVRRRMREARTHLHFCVQVYHNQLSRGKDFLHEHPLGASSWREEGIEVLANDPRVSTVVGDLCRYDLKIADANGIVKPIKKPTRWMSSSSEMLERLKKRCDGSHQHGSLLDGKAKYAAIWPNRLCIDILKGMRDTAFSREVKEEFDRYAEVENSITSMLMSFIDYGETACEYKHGASRGLRGIGTAPPERILASTALGTWSEKLRYYDEMTNIELPAKLVEAARAEELEYFNSLPVWDIARTQECWDVTGKPPISTKWVDVNKGDQESYDVRSRLVAREMGGGKNDEFYAPTPPLEDKRLLFSEAATCRRTGKNEKKLLFVDARKAYFNAKVDRPTYVALPAEVSRPGVRGR